MNNRRWDEEEKRIAIDMRNENKTAKETVEALRKIGYVRNISSIRTMLRRAKEEGIVGEYIRPTNPATYTDVKEEDAQKLQIYMR